MATIERRARNIIVSPGEKHGNLGDLEALLDEHPDLLTLKRGGTLLRRAVELDRMDAMMLLLRKGCDPGILDNNNMTALEYCESRKKHEKNEAYRHLHGVLFPKPPGSVGSPGKEPSSAGAERGGCVGKSPQDGNDEAALGRDDTSAGALGVDTVRGGTS
eukprot:CAMPEP_0119125458 /NCGR_PEP_ID=MMETSP1310-20130426/4725_1 /TAXON_ID=464262 /ORGANISM="Genus nov. species nov., Strain RCC2339" /LENGTH=159 /DNA_ID=CAMNT_0007115529 /DNA_START=58 /DNA_END=533 /DNA_ORIENTATION=-